MVLVKCRNCSAQLSPNAKACPNCGQPAKPVNLERCRACSTLLDPTIHRPVELASGVKDGTTTNHYYTRHVPCPKCGEPKPLASAWETPLGNIAVYVIIPILLVWAFWVVFTKQIGLGTFTMPTTLEGWTLLFVPSIFVYMGALLITVVGVTILEKFLKT